MDLYKTLEQLVKDSDWASLSQLSTALNSGEWDSMSDAEQQLWLEELNEE